MQSGADNGEILAICDRTVESRQRILRDDWIREDKECAVSDQRLQMSQRFDRRSNHVGEVIDEIGGREFAVGVRQGGIPGNVDEAKRRFDGCAVIHEDRPMPD